MSCCHTVFQTPVCGNGLMNLLQPLPLPQHHHSHITYHNNKVHTCTSMYMYICSRQFSPYTQNLSPSHTLYVRFQSHASIFPDSLQSYHVAGPLDSVWEHEFSNHVDREAQDWLVELGAGRFTVTLYTTLLFFFRSQQFAPTEDEKWYIYIQ